MQFFKEGKIQRYNKAKKELERIFTVVETSVREVCGDEKAKQVLNLIVERLKK